MKVLVVQETDWVARNPILHHRMLESIALAGDEVLVLDYEILWRRNGDTGIFHGRRVMRDVTKFFPGSGLTVIRPAMLRVPVVARPFWLLTSAVELERAFRSFQPDVVVAYGISSSLVARILSRLHGVPFVFHIFDSLHAIAEPTFLAPIARIVEQTVLRSSGRVIVVHRALLAYVRRMGVRQARVRFIMNGFHSRAPDPERTEAERGRLGVASDEVVILFVGWLYRHAGLVTIGRQLVGSDRFRGYRLVVAGDGDAFEELSELAADPERGHRISMLGRVPVQRIPDLIDAADVGLCASAPDPAMRYIVPAKVDEYLEGCRPVVATRLPGLLEELGSEPSIIWVDGPDGALEALEAELAGRPDAREHLRAKGASAREYGAGREGWDAVTRRFREVLDEVASPAGSPAA